MSVVYEISTKLTLVNGVSGVLAVISKEVLHLEGGIKSLNTQLHTMRGLLAIGGSLSIAGGVGLLTALKSVADHGDKLLDQQDKLRRAGIAQNEVLRVQAQYYDKIAKSVPTATAADYLRTYNELRSVVGADRAEAKTPWALKLESVMANMTGSSAEGQGFKILRALEMKGITLSDPAMSDRLADIMMKNIIGSGGKLSASDFEALAKRGGAAWMAASPEFIAGPLSNIASDLGGQSTGTALMTLRQMTSGATVLGKQQAQELERLGMIKPGFLNYNKGGDVTSMKPGGIVGADLANTNAAKWVQDILLPRLKETYGDDQSAIAQSIAKIGRNRNTIRMLTMFADPGFREQMDKDYALWQQAHSIDRSYSDAMKTNPTMIKQAFHGQYESMLPAIGAPMMQAAIPVMKAVTELFTKIGAWANANPEAIKKIAMGLAALGAVLVGAGVAAIIAAIMPASGWLILGMTALGAAFGKFPKDSLASLVKAMTEDIPNGIRSMLMAFDILIAKFKDWIASVGGFFGQFTVGGGQSYADSAARMRGMSIFGPSAGGRSMSGVGGGKLGFSPSGPIGPTSSYSGENHPLFASIIRAEGTAKYGDPYQTSLGYMRPPKPLTEMTMAESLAWGDRVRAAQGLNSSAKGAFQIVNSTQRRAMAALGLTGSDMFSRENQRKMAWWIAQHQGLGAWEGFKRHPGELSNARRGLQGPPPSKRDQHTQVHTDIHLDGHKIASAISSHLARAHTHPRHAPYASRGTFMGPDHQFAVG